MPIGPEQFREARRSHIIEREIAELDNKLRDMIQKWSDGDLYSMKVIKPDNCLSHIEKELVCDKYVKAGWSSVKHRTSAENGDRPGLISYTFYF